MVRIGTNPDLTRRDVQPSYFTTEFHICNGNSHSNLYPSGPWVSNYSADHPHIEFSSFSLDINRGKLASQKRPFFDKDYHFIKNGYTASSLSSVAFQGSGVLASDEIYANQGEGYLIASGVYSLEGQLSLLANDDYTKVEDSVTCLHGDYQIDLNGSVGKHTLELSKNMGDWINAWMYYADKNYTIDDAILLAQGSDWGRNLVNNEFFVENLSSSYPTSPLLPKTVFNPISGQRGINHKSTLNPPNQYPEQLFSDMSDLATKLYSNRYYTSSNSYVVESAILPTDFLPKVYGWEDGATYGTSSNAFEKGSTDINNCVWHSMIYFNKAEINYREEGVSKIINFSYFPLQYYKDVYYSYSSSQPVSAQLTGQDIYYSYAVGAFLDTRFTEIYSHSPETLQTINLSSLPFLGSNFNIRNYFSNIALQRLQGNSETESIFLRQRDIFNFQQSATVIPASVLPGYCLSSSYQAVIFNRPENNPWGLGKACVGIVTRLSKNFEDSLYARRGQFMSIDFWGALFSGTPSQGNYEVLPDEWGKILNTQQMKNSPALNAVNITATTVIRTQGWKGFYYYIVAGTDVADVISKIKNLYDNGDFETDITPEVEIPEIVRKLVRPAKSQYSW